MPASSWLLTGLLVALLFAASAPSPMYQLYADIYGFDAVTLTSIYAVYAFGALGALLLGGRLSDHLGRRPVVVFALVVQLAGMAAFIAAQGVEGLFAGRTLQGIGTGIATAAVGAWLLDLSPPTRAGSGIRCPTRWASSCPAAHGNGRSASIRSSRPVPHCS